MTLLLRLPRDAPRLLQSSTMSLVRKASFESGTPVSPNKRLKLDNEPRPLLNYKNAVVLAPMVRSSTLPSRLLALRYGADLVWGPETIDQAIIGCERVVDPATGLVSYFRGGPKALFTTHPVEKPYVIYQVGSSSPELAAKAAKMVSQDVSGIDLNCGCPKSFSTSGGMGAALLSTPDLLCDILKSIRAAVPPEVSVSCKIRLLPTEEATLALVKQIVETKAIRALTVHCRTRNQRMGERARVERLTAIVNLCRELDPDLAVIQNGDCVSRKAAVAVRELTGCDSVMIATAAESNLSCFLDGPVVDAQTELIPRYLRLSAYFQNTWGNTKHCVSQFKSPHAVAPEGSSKSAKRDFRDFLAKAKGYTDMKAWMGSLDGGAAVLQEVRDVLKERESRKSILPPLDLTGESQELGLPVDIPVPPTFVEPPQNFEMSEIRVDVGPIISPQEVQI